MKSDGFLGDNTYKFPTFLPIPIKNSSLTFYFSCTMFRILQNIIILINFPFYLTIHIKNS